MPGRAEEREREELEAELKRTETELALLRKLEEVAAEQRESAETAVGGSVPSWPANVGVFAVAGYGGCLSGLQKISGSRVKRVIGEQRQLLLSFFAYAGATLPAARAVWTGHNEHKTPNLEQVYAVSKQLELDVVVMANVNCSPHGNSAEAIQPFDVWVIDTRANQAFHARDKNLNFINVVRSVIAPYLSSY